MITNLKVIHKNVQIIYNHPVPNGFCFIRYVSIREKKDLTYSLSINLLNPTIYFNSLTASRIINYHYIFNQQLQTPLKY